ncbi:MAG: plasmid pRiA4b ORF-3 family protein [Bacteroidales bacterium]|jgi:hypothetical protein
MKTLYQIKITLKHTNPKVWRRVLVLSDMLLSDLHEVIQITMGWTDSHLHRFVKNRTYYTAKPEDDDPMAAMRNVVYKGLHVSALLKEEKEKIVYEYDFGDDWEHELVLEKISPVYEKLNYPICIAGKRCCPPEDCGGPWGYTDMLEVLKNPEHKQYQHYIDWLEGDFDPEYFDKDIVNAFLHCEENNL